MRSLVSANSRTFLSCLDESRTVPTSENRMNSLSLKNNTHPRRTRGDFRRRRRFILLRLFLFPLGRHCNLQLGFHLDWDDYEWRQYPMFPAIAMVTTSGVEDSSRKETRHERSQFVEDDHTDPRKRAPGFLLTLNTLDSLFLIDWVIVVLVIRRRTHHSCYSASSPAVMHYSHGRLILISTLFTWVLSSFYSVECRLFERRERRNADLIVTKYCSASALLWRPTCRFRG